MLTQIDVTMKHCACHNMQSWDINTIRLTLSARRALLWDCVSYTLTDHYEYILTHFLKCCTPVIFVLIIDHYHMFTCFVWRWLSRVSLIPPSHKRYELGVSHVTNTKCFTMLITLIVAMWVVKLSAVNGGEPATKFLVTPNVFRMKVTWNFVRHSSAFAMRMVR